ncbi:MAG: hypothetical protein ACODAA_03965 [Gemmatimonadota bacterium]
MSDLLRFSTLEEKAVLKEGAKESPPQKEPKRRKPKNIGELAVRAYRRASPEDRRAIRSALDAIDRVEREQAQREAPEQRPRIDPRAAPNTTSAEALADRAAVARRIRELGLDPVAAGYSGGDLSRYQRPDPGAERLRAAGITPGGVVQPGAAPARAVPGDGSR